MIRSITIENFKCFKSITLEHMSRINLFLGPNNVGKSALLEALWVNNSFYTANVLPLINKLRNWNRTEIHRLFFEFFNNFDNKKAIQFKCAGDTDFFNRSLTITSYILSSSTLLTDSGVAMLDSLSHQPRGVKFDCTIKEQGKSVESIAFPTIDGITINSAKSQGAFNVFLISDSSKFRSDEYDTYGTLIRDGLEQIVLDAINEFEPSIEAIRMIPFAGENFFHVKVPYLTNYIPINLLGQGLGRLLRIVLAFIQARNGSIMIDEIENGFYHKNLATVWSQIHVLAERFNVQVFATTHSYECVEAAHEALKGKEALSLYRLNRVDADIKVTEYDESSLAASIEYGIEVR